MQHKIEFDLEPIGQTLREKADAIQKAMEKRGIRIKYEPAKFMPEGVEDLEEKKSYALGMIFSGTGEIANRCLGEANPCDYTQLSWIMEDLQYLGHMSWILRSDFNEMVELFEAFANAYREVYQIRCRICGVRFKEDVKKVPFIE